jgi:hypothetical protein
VFKRSETQPDTPVGGSYNNPKPAGWSDTVPPINEYNKGPVYMSFRTFYAGDDNYDSS